VYYPPYHSKYNPIERLWGILENYWRGELGTFSRRNLLRGQFLLWFGWRGRLLAF
jgi:transposase